MLIKIQAANTQSHVNFSIGNDQMVLEETSETDDRPVESGSDESMKNRLPQLRSSLEYRVSLVSCPMFHSFFVCFFSSSDQEI